MRLYPSRSSSLNISSFPETEFSNAFKILEAEMNPEAQEERDRAGWGERERERSRVRKRLQKEMKEGPLKFFIPSSAAVRINFLMTTKRAEPSSTSSSFAYQSVTIWGESAGRPRVYLELQLLVGSVESLQAIPLSTLQFKRQSLGVVVSRGYCFQEVL
jgi:hypothetical protein